LTLKTLILLGPAERPTVRLWAKAAPLKEEALEVVAYHFEREREKVSLSLSSLTNSAVARGKKKREGVVCLFEKGGEGKGSRRERERDQIKQREDV
jgi:hypothetical protein